MSIIQFQKEFFKSGSEKRVFVIHGDETYLVKSFLAKLKQKFKENYRVLWGDEIDEEAFYSNLSETSIFGSTKESAIVIYNFEEFVKKLGRRKKNLQFLINTLKKVKRNYVFIVFDRKLQKQELVQEPIKSISAFGEIIVANKLTKDKVKNLVLKKFKDNGIIIEDRAIDKLLELSEYNLMELKLEVEKLIDYAKESKKITEEDIKKVAFFVSGNSNVFDFIDAFFSGDREKSINLYENLLMWGIHPLQVQKLLVSFAIKLYILNKLIEKGESEDKALEKVGVKNNYMKLKFKNYLKNLNEEKLRKLINTFQRIDMFEKIYFQDPEQMLRNIVYTGI